MSSNLDSLYFFTLLLLFFCNVFMLHVEPCYSIIESILCLAVLKNI